MDKDECGLYSHCIFYNSVTNLSKNEEKVVAEADDCAWVEEFGIDGAATIRETVDANLPDYEYLAQFAIKA